MSELQAQEETIVNTLCRLCEAGCGVQATVRNGRLVKTEGLPEHPTSKGGLCVRGMHAPEIVHSRHRLRTPLLRSGERGDGNWKEISWGAALEQIGTKLDELRSENKQERFAFYRGQASDWGAPWHYAQRFMFAYGSPNVTAPSHVCYFPRMVAEIATYGGIVSPDYERAAVIVEWGASRPASHLPYWRRVQKALKRGAKLVVIDPVRSVPAKRADIWLRVRPGTDGALALSMIDVIIQEGLYDKAFVEEWTEGFEALAALAAEYPAKKAEQITWVPAEEIRRTARLIASDPAATIHAANGLEHHTNTFQTMRAVACLRALSGTLEAPGGNIFTELVKWSGLKGKDLLPADKKPLRLGSYDLFTDMCSVIPFPAIVDAILSGEPYPLKGLFVMGGNPVATMPNPGRVIEALKKLEFLVVADPFMTQTARLADIVLPAATQYEQTSFNASNMFGETLDHVLLQQKVVEVEGCRADWEILQGLAHQLGLEQAFPWKDVEEAINVQLAPSGITVEQMKKHPGGVRYKQGEKYRTYLDRGFGTPSGKVEFLSQMLAQRGYETLPRWEEPAESPSSQPDKAKDFPLIGFAAGKAFNYLHSQFRNIPALRQREPDPWAGMNPEEASARGIMNGDWIVIRSPRGSIRVKAVVSDTIPPGLLSISGCWGEAMPESNMNILVDDRERDPISGTTGSRSFLCEVQKVQDDTV
jgi:anaerobic selenocysteine-containing dehydrogenase